jgi:hypothetical protein
MANKSPLLTRPEASTTFSSTKGTQLTLEKQFLSRLVVQALLRPLTGSKVVAMLLTS